VLEIDIMLTVIVYFVGFAVVLLVSGCHFIRILNFLLHKIFGY